MIYLAILRRALPFLLILGAILGGWWWHVAADERAMAAAYEKGQDSILNQWEKADDIAVAVGAAKSDMLAKGAKQNEADFQRRRAADAARVAVVSVDRDRANRELDALRMQLDERNTTPAAQTSDPDSCPAARRDAAKLRSCEGLLSSGLGLAGEARSLVDGAEELLGRTEAALEALQEWANLVANEAR
jgi:hypothetical protein